MAIRSRRGSGRPGQFNAHFERAFLIETRELHQGQRCTSLDLIHRSMSDYVIHSTAGIIGEVDSILSRMP
jgi:hypothetical protein